MKVETSGSLLSLLWLVNSCVSWKPGLNVVKRGYMSLYYVIIISLKWPLKKHRSPIRALLNHVTFIIHVHSVFCEERKIRYARVFLSHYFLLKRFSLSSTAAIVTFHIQHPRHLGPHCLQLKIKYKLSNIQNLTSSRLTPKRTRPYIWPGLHSWYTNFTTFTMWSPDTSFYAV